jgi:tRNA(Arg) A34 adenosine deaminase TadA
MSNEERSFMQIALAEAELAGTRGEVPIGAVIVDAEGRELARAGNRTIELADPTAHAEMLAIRAACAALGLQRLTDCDIHVTLEPCAMCATAISFARLARVFYGAPDPKGGGIDYGARIYTQPTCHHRPQVFGGISQGRSAEMLRDFFRARR